jgi:hypothetical protein
MGRFLRTGESPLEGGLGNSGGRRGGMGAPSASSDHAVVVFHRHIVTEIYLCHAYSAVLCWVGQVQRCVVLEVHEPGRLGLVFPTGVAPLVVRPQQQPTHECERR